ncbi:MAG: insulinase family protein [Candidatus Comchoanobacterales bacterium]
MQLLRWILLLCLPVCVFAQWTETQDKRFASRTYSFTKQPFPILIIHDPNVEKSIVSIAVSSGSLNDGKHLGLAHLTEHMLFLGNKTYTNEDDLSHWLGKHGGYTNAYTLPDTTNYYMVVDHAFLNEALKRFTAMFNPLLKEDQIKKAIHTVNQEHQKNANQPSWMQTYFARSMLFPDSIRGKFHTGNQSTLSDVDENTIREFFDLNYTQGSFYGVVLTSQPLEPLKKETLDKMTQLHDSRPKQTSIPTTPAPIAIKPRYAQLTTTETIPGYFSVHWVSPWSKHLYHTGRLLHGLFTQDDHGTLFRALKDQDLIESAAYHQNTPNKQQQMHSLIFFLTDKGNNNISKIQSIIDDYFKFLAKLDSIPQDFIDLMNKSDKRYYQQEDPGYIENMVPSIADKMRHHMPLDEIFKPINYEKIIASSKEALQKSITHSAMSLQQKAPEGQKDEYYNFYFQYTAQNSDNEKQIEQPHTWRIPKNPFIDISNPPKLIDTLPVHVSSTFINPNSINLMDRQSSQDKWLDLKNFYTFPPYQKTDKWTHFAGPSWQSPIHTVVIQWGNESTQNLKYKLFDDIIDTWYNLNTEILRDQISYVSQDLIFNNRQLSLSGPYDFLSPSLEKALTIINQLDEPSLKKDFDKIKRLLTIQYSQTINLSSALQQHYSALRNNQFYTREQLLKSLHGLTKENIQEVINYHEKSHSGALIFSDAEAQDIKDVLNAKLQPPSFVASSLELYDYKDQTIHTIQYNDPSQHGILIWRHLDTETFVDYDRYYLYQMMDWILSNRYFTQIRTNLNLGYIAHLAHSLFPYSPTLITLVQSEKPEKELIEADQAFFDHMCSNEFSDKDLKDYHHNILTNLKTPSIQLSKLIVPYIQDAFSLTPSLNLAEYYAHIQNFTPSKFKTLFRDWCEKHQTQVIKTSDDGVNNMKPTKITVIK